VTAPLPPPYGPPPQYGPPTQYGPQPYGPWGIPGPPRTNSLAITSLVCAIAGLFVFCLPSIPAIVMGAVALRQIRQRGENGEGLALAGVIIGVCGIVLAIVGVIVLGVLLSAVQRNCTTGC
jgi:chromate transport protein ChrA